MWPQASYIVLWASLFFICEAESNWFLFFVFFRAIPTAYGSSQARSRIRAVAAGLHHSHSNARSELCLRHSNAGSLTHWVRPGFKPASSWILVRFVSAEPWRELLILWVKTRENCQNHWLPPNHKFLWTLPFFWRWHLMLFLSASSPHLPASGLQVHRAGLLCPVRSPWPVFFQYRIFFFS